MGSKSGNMFRSKNIEMAGYKFFRNIKYDKEYCDVTFHIAGNAVSVHCIIIAAAIPYYRQLFSNKNGAGEESYKEKEFILPDGTDPSAFENLIEYAYSGEMEITDENVKCLLSAACHLGVDEVTEACRDFLLNSLSPENVFRIRDFACDLKNVELLKDIDEYICENFSEISEMEQFCSLPYQCVDELLSMDDLCVSSEEKVFTSVMKWVGNCPEQRKANLPHLLKKVRLALLAPIYLRNHVASEHLIHESIPCRDLLDEARNYHLFPEDRATPPSFPLAPRCKEFSTGSPKGNQTMCVFSGSYTFTTEKFNQVEQSWKTEASRYFDYIISSAAVVGTKLYYFHTADVMEYDPSKNEYKFCKGLNCYKYYYGIASVNGKIYICGGERGNSYFNTADCYDPEKNAWENVSDMRECRSSPGVTTLSESIYVLGGTNGISIHTSVEKYNLQACKWKAVPSMLTARCACGCATLEGRIYVCGGITTSKIYTPTAEVYDPMSNKWMSISSINTLRSYCKLLPYQGKLHTIGGKDANGGRLNTVEIYDPNSNKWTPGKELNGDRVISAAEVIPSP